MTTSSFAKLASSFLLLLLLPDLTASKCTEFYTDSQEGYYTYPLPTNHHPYLGQIAVSLVIDCTASSGFTSDCPLPSSARYAVALPRDTFLLKWSDNKFIFHDRVINTLVKETLGEEKVKWINFDEPIYQNYTIPFNSSTSPFPGYGEEQEIVIPVGTTSYVSYARVTHCFSGALKGCSGEHAGLDREIVTVCGAAREKGSGGALPADRQRYLGLEFVVERNLTPDEVKNQPPLNWTRADEFDWSKVGGGEDGDKEGPEVELRRREGRILGDGGDTMVQGKYRVPEGFALLETGH